MDSLMDDLRKLSMQFVMHKSLEASEFLLAAIQCLTLMDERDALAVAEMFLNARPGGDGQ